MNIDIASLSISMSTQNVINDVGVAMLSKSLETNDNLADGLRKIMEASVTPHIGQNIDCSL